MPYSVIDKQDIFINLSDDSTILIDPRYNTKTNCTLFVYYQTIDQDNPTFVSSCRYELGSGDFYVPFYYSNFDLIVFTDPNDNTIVVQEVDKTNG